MYEQGCSVSDWNIIFKLANKERIMNKRELSLQLEAAVKKYLRTKDITVVKSRRKPPKQTMTCKPYHSFVPTSTSPQGYPRRSAGMR